MIRRFNYTGRKKIPRSQISIALYETEGNKLAFDASIDFKRLILSQDGNIYIEAYRRAYLQRFKCGTIKDPKFPKNYVLEGLGPDSLVRFRIKIVDKKGRLLAVGDRISPRRLEEESGNKLCLLHADFLGLGQLIWRLDLDGDWPILQLNHKLENIREIARSEPSFLTLVYPEIVRQILYRIIVTEDHTDPESDGEDDWMSAWLKFALLLIGGGKQLPPSGESEPILQENLKCIDDVVDAFCSSNQILDKFAKSLKIRES